MSVASEQAPVDVENNTQKKLVVRKVASDAPIQWLKKGIADFKAATAASMLLGLVYVLTSATLILMAWGNPIYITALATAFLMIGPVVAVGFYCISCQLEQGKKPSVAFGVESMVTKLVTICCFALVLGAVMGVWGLVSAVSFALFFDSLIITDDLINTILGQDNFIPFLIVYIITTLFIATLSFSISVISAPLITNRKVDFVTAMITSVKAVKKNPVPMFSWALMIAVLILVGLMLGFVGLAITLPIVGHATWHAYRDIIES